MGKERRGQGDRRRLRNGKGKKDRGGYVDKGEKGR